MPNQSTLHWANGKPLDQVPDFPGFRERAHRERSRVMNQTVALVWNRISGRCARLSRDAAFWQA